jgi:hypothetical protein
MLDEAQPGDSRAGHGFNKEFERPYRQRIAFAWESA